MPENDDKPSENIDLPLRVDEISKKIDLVSEKLEETTARHHEEASRAARVVVLEELQKTTNALRDVKEDLKNEIGNTKELIQAYIAKRFKRMQMYVTAIAAGLTIVSILLGWFGIDKLLPSVVTDAIGDAARVQFQILTKQAENFVAQISKARETLQHNPLIVLQTDYGSKSHYMATLMGSIYSINPYARIQVITSEIDSFDLIHAAWTLRRASRFYPDNTIFVAITNPGGITGQTVVLQTDEPRHIYIGPDNGIFDLVAKDYGVDSSYRITNKALYPAEFEGLFGGIDLFAPAAGHLSIGFPVEDIGKEFKYYSKLPGFQYIVASSGIAGTVVDIDRYGNVTTNIDRFDLKKLGIEIGEDLSIDIGGAAYRMPLRERYGRVSVGELVAVFHEAFLQIAINEGNFAAGKNLGRGDEIVAYKGKDMFQKNITNQEER